MARQTVSRAPSQDNAVLVSKNADPRLMKGAVGAQDFNKRTTATRPIRGNRSVGRSLGGKR